jgi:N-acetylneuraminic acid mutarotase
LLPPPYYQWNSSAEINGSGISFTMNGLGYIMDNIFTIMSSFDPAENKFTYVGTYQDWSWVKGSACVVNNDTVYLINGGKGIYRFDFVTSQWIRIGETPIPDLDGIAFSLNGRLFYGLPSSANIDKFWEYKSSTKSWILKNPFPGAYEQLPLSFTINNKGYALFYDNVLYEYNPDADSWTRKSPYPGAGQYVYGRVAFAINNLGYVGLGRELYSETAYNDLWIYDPASDSWTKSIPMPGIGRFNSISFTLGSKAYLGFGYTYPVPGLSLMMNDFYMYDPGNILK